LGRRWGLHWGILPLGLGASGSIDMERVQVKVEEAFVGVSGIGLIGIVEGENIHFFFYFCL